MRYLPRPRHGNLWTRLRHRVQEIIGRFSTRLRVHYPQRVTVDYTQTDYEFWDKLRRGKLFGYEIGGLFARPITQIITSWALGDGLAIDTGHQGTNEALSAFLNDELQALVEFSEDGMALGDSYIVVNPDGSLTQVPPSQVDIEVDDEDIRRITQVTITSMDQERGVMIKDIYTDSERTVRIERTSGFGTFQITTDVQEQTFPNPIGRIPVVHFANDRSSNEVYGHPYYEELLTLFAEYDDVVRKGLDGVKLMGNPIPVFEKLQDADSARVQDSTYTDTYTDRENVTRDADIVELDPHEVLYTSGEFNFKSPGNFTPNTKDMLKVLFLLMLQNSQIPEWAWGGAIASSMASVNAQFPAFARFIGGRRRKLERPLRALVEIWLAMMALFTPGIRADVDLAFQWPELIPDDDEVKLKWVQFMDAQGYLQKATVLRLSELVDDPEDEIQQAMLEAQEREQQFQDSVEASIQRLMQRDDSPAIGADDDRLQANGNGRREALSA